VHERGGSSSLAGEDRQHSRHFGGHTCLFNPSYAPYGRVMSDTTTPADGVLSPGSTATGSGTSMGEDEIADAGAPDGAQRLPKTDS
jgi:hypothetical protein